MHVYERANYQCELCGSIKGLQEHHIVRRSQGGKDTEENLILLCWDCHHGKDSIKIEKQLKLALQEYYFEQGYSEEEVRKLMGGKLYLGTVKDWARLHFIRRVS